MMGYGKMVFVGMHHMACNFNCSSHQIAAQPGTVPEGLMHVHSCASGRKREHKIQTIQGPTDQIVALQQL